MAHLVEHKIAEHLINELVSKGHVLTVDDGEAFPIVKSTDRKAILDALFSVDEEHILVDKAGWIFLVHGNDGYDVIADYSVNLETEIVETLAFAQTWE